MTKHDGEGADEDFDDAPKARFSQNTVYVFVGLMLVATIAITVAAARSGNYFMAVIGLAIVVAFVVTSRPGRS